MHTPTPLLMLVCSLEGVGDSILEFGCQHCVQAVDMIIGQAYKQADTQKSLQHKVRVTCGAYRHLMGCVMLLRCDVLSWVVTMVHGAHIAA